MDTWWAHSYYQYGGATLLISWIFWVIFSITLHELAHGWAAIWQGDDTPIRYQRMTMNPLVHMGGMSLIVFAIIGIAWGVMPTDPSKYRWKRQGRIFVSGAGPAMNILLALLSLSAVVMWEAFGPKSQPLANHVSTFFFTGGWLNIVLAVFNLLPIPPLDGSSVLSGLSFKAYRFYQNPNVQTYGFLVLLAVFLSGIGGFLFSFALTLSNAYVNGLVALLP